MELTLNIYRRLANKLVSSPLFILNVFQTHKMRINKIETTNIATLVTLKCGTSQTAVGRQQGMPFVTLYRGMFI